MVSLSKQAVIEYQQIYRKTHGKDISYQEALAQGIKLIRLVEIIFKPMTEAEYQQLQKRRRQTGDL